MNLTTDKAKAVAIFAGLALAGFVAWKLYRGGGAVLDAATQFVTETANPFSDQNAVYRTFESTDAKGNEIPLGVQLYDSTHNADGSIKWPWQ